MSIDATQTYKAGSVLVDNPHDSLPRLGRSAITQMTLGLMPRGLGIQVEINCSAAGGTAIRSDRTMSLAGIIFAVHTTVVAIVRTDCGAFEGDSGKQATRP